MTNHAPIMQSFGKRDEVRSGTEVGVDIVDVGGPVTMVGVTIRGILRQILNDWGDPDLYILPLA